MNTIEGQYFGGRYPVANEASMEIGQQETVVTAGSYSRRFATVDLIVSPGVGSTYRFISLPDGSQFGCVDDALLNSLTQENKSEGICHTDGKTCQSDRKKWSQFRLALHSSGHL
jgi:hypothetical protein